MPCDYKKYPTTWTAVSLDIRTNRAGNKCERCGAENYQPHPVTGSKVVLTVAHQCECDPLCANPDHLLALCQRDHLIQDAKLHARNAAITRRKKKNNQELFPDLADWRFS